MFQNLGKVLLECNCIWCIWCFYCETGQIHFLNLPTVQVMACCHKTTSHNLNQRTDEDQWQIIASLEDNVLVQISHKNNTLAKDILFSINTLKCPGDGGGRPSSVMSLGVTSVGGHSHGHPASPIGVGSSWEDIDPRSPEPLVVRGGWIWLIWVVRWTT